MVSSALWTGIKSASLRPPSKHEFEIPLFMIVVKGLEQIVLFSFRNFGGMLLDIDAFLPSNAATSFSIVSRLTAVNEKLPFITLSSISLILGWLAYVEIMLSIGSSVITDSSFLYSLGIFTLRDLTVLLKNHQGF